jgi:hypothetical protein
MNACTGGAQADALSSLLVPIRRVDFARALPRNRLGLDFSYFPAPLHCNVTYHCTASGWAANMPCGPGVYSLMIDVPPEMRCRVSGKSFGDIHDR